jgi:hypothetical protein
MHNLESLIQSPHPVVRTEAIHKLAQNPTNAAELIPLLNAALFDADSAVRLATTNVLGRISYRPPATPQLTEPRINTDRGVYLV